METILNSSFDWTGIRQPFVVATENDALNGVSRIFGHLINSGLGSWRSTQRYYRQSCCPL